MFTLWCMGGYGKIGIQEKNYTFVAATVFSCAMLRTWVQSKNQQGVIFCSEQHDVHVYSQL